MIVELELNRWCELEIQRQCHGNYGTVVVDINEDTGCWKPVFVGVACEWDQWGGPLKYMPYPINLVPLTSHIDSEVEHICEEHGIEIPDDYEPIWVGGYNTPNF